MNARRARVAPCVLGIGAGVIALASCQVNPTAANPATSTAGLRFVAVAAADFHSCGLSSVGSVYCWGSNFVGQVGDGTTTDRFSPALVTGMPALISITAGRQHNCGLTADGLAYCWGGNGFGGLGDGTTISPMRPVAVTGGMTFSFITAGGDHTCGLTASAAAYCWGDNRQGELGNGDTTRFVASPSTVAGGHRFSSLSAGGSHTCGVAIAEGVYCWGNGFNPQMGDVFYGAARPTPKLVAGGSDFVRVSGGTWHTCAVTSAGTVYCWGLNIRGQLGVGSALAGSVVPVRLPSDLSFSAVDAGYSHSCAVTTAGAAHCWGDDSEQQLGRGAGLAGGFGYLPVAVAGGVTFAEVSTGTVHSCGVSTSGALYCWGSNSNGQSGHSGGPSHSAAPVLVAGKP